MGNGQWAITCDDICPFNWFVNGEWAINVVYLSTLPSFIQIIYKGLLALLSSPPQPAGLRNCNAAVFAS